MVRALSCVFALALCCIGTSCSQQPAPVATADPGVGKDFDAQLASMEKEFVPLVDAMPADKFEFAPTQGAFDKVRNFGQQAKHVAAVMYIVSAAILNEKPPVETGGESGPDTAKTKDQVMDFVKNAFTYAHKAEQSLTSANLLDQLKSPFGSGQMSRNSLAVLLISHGFDHYGQMVEYARMNNVIPPASR